MSIGGSLSPLTGEQLERGSFVWETLRVEFTRHMKDVLVNNIKRRIHGDEPASIRLFDEPILQKFEDALVG